MTQTPHDLIRAEIDKLSKEFVVCKDVRKLISALDCAVEALDTCVVCREDYASGIAEEAIQTISKILIGMHEIL